jgi:hypothetical protein
MFVVPKAYTAKGGMKYWYDCVEILMELPVQLTLMQIVLRE